MRNHAATAASRHCFAASAHRTSLGTAPWCFYDLGSGCRACPLRFGRCRIKLAIALLDPPRPDMALHRDADMVWAIAGTCRVKFLSGFARGQGENTLAQARALRAGFASRRFAFGCFWRPSAASRRNRGLFCRRSRSGSPTRRRLANPRQYAFGGLEIGQLSGDLFAVGIEAGKPLADLRWVVAIAGLGVSKLLAGAIEEAIPAQEQAIRLSPRDPHIANWYWRIGMVHLLKSRIGEAITWLQRAQRANPLVAGPRAWLAAAQALAGDIEHAAAELAEARRLGDDRYSTIAAFNRAGRFGTQLQALAETTFFEGLRKAGVPEK